MKRIHLNQFAFGLAVTLLSSCSSPATTALPLTETPAPTASPTATVAAIETVSPKVELFTPTPTREKPTPEIPALTLRKPTNNQLEEYLKEFLETRPGPPYPPRGVREVHYHDLNGDGVDELVVDGASFVAVMLWQDTSYSTPFIFDILEHLNERIYLLNSILEFEDWTNDGIDEIVYKFRTEFSATPFGSDTATYRWIHCDLTECRQVLEIEADFLLEDIINGGESIGRTGLTRYVDENGSPAIRALQTGFAVNCCGGFDGPPMTEEEQMALIDKIRSFRVRKSIVWTYVWNGREFEQVSEEIANLGYDLSPTAQYQAHSSKSVEAALSIKSPEQIDVYVDDQCLLHVAGTGVGDWFQCQKKYTRVEWRDLTGDRQEEVVVTALVGRYAERYGEWQYCSRLHVFAYQWDGKQATRIVDAEACIVETDMFGVRIEDYDSDGQLEVLVADPAPGWTWGEAICDSWEVPCWYDRDYAVIIYEWNGSTFTP